MLICEQKQAEQGKWVRLRSGKRDAGRRVKDKEREGERREISGRHQREREAHTSTFTPANMT